MNDSKAWPGTQDLVAHIPTNEVKFYPYKKVGAVKLKVPERQGRAQNACCKKIIIIYI